MKNKYQIAIAVLVILIVLSVIIKLQNKTIQRLQGGLSSSIMIVELILETSGWKKVELPPGMLVKKEFYEVKEIGIYNYKCNNWGFGFTSSISHDKQLVEKLDAHHILFFPILPETTMYFKNFGTQFNYIWIKEVK